jgi:V/A-type H+-transporting ATPase subunit C
MAKTKKINEYDYLFLSAYIHAKEPKLVGKTRLERMIDSRTPEAALKVLEDAWQLTYNVEDLTMSELEPLLSKRRGDVLSDMWRLSPNKAIVDAFRVKYDYHNAKVLVKARRMDLDGGRLMSMSGRVTPNALKEAVLEGNLKSLPGELGRAIPEASDALATSGDPQLADFILDCAYYREFLKIAGESGSKFLIGFAKLSADASNFRSAIRAIRSKQELHAALVEGGTVEVKKLITAADKPETLPELFSGTPLRPAIEAAQEALLGGQLSRFELLCDNALLGYLSAAKASGFSEKPLIGYIAAVDNEIAAVRTVMTGQFAGLESETIRSRLREGYTL